MFVFSFCNHYFVLSDSDNEVGFSVISFCVSALLFQANRLTKIVLNFLLLSLFVSLLIPFSLKNLKST